MNLEAATAERSGSPASSPHSIAVPRASRRAEEDGIHKGDKTFRRYSALIERALSSWETSPEEWADYIAFLGRLLKSIQSHPKDVTVLPHSSGVASKLAQCMNPALPSGVHQKALEVYAYIFSTFGQKYLSDHLDDLFPGLSAVLSFASLSVRPALYELLENNIIPLSDLELRPLLKALVLSLLPALEEETSEDFDRAFRILETLERKFTRSGDSSAIVSKAGFFWQCLFLSIITSPPRRQGALNFLAHKLPKFEDVTSSTAQGASTDVEESTSRLSAESEAVVSPEPGLLIRAFVCGLSDAQILIQRGFLDLLVTHLPLSSPLLQSRIGNEDLDRLIHAAMRVLLRREMSLNRRLWSWFLGPEQKAEGLESQPSSPRTHRDHAPGKKENVQLTYFTSYGKTSLERCVLAMFRKAASSTSEQALPFRLCLSLMDRWEIGGSIVPQMFLPALESAYEYSAKAAPTAAADLVRSASLFFDSIEANLIWSNLFSLLNAAFEDPTSATAKLHLFRWIVQRFNIADEEMATIHIPRCILFLRACLADAANSGQMKELRVTALEIMSTLLENVPERALAHSATSSMRTAGLSSVGYSEWQATKTAIARQYGVHAEQSNGEAPGLPTETLSTTLYQGLATLVLQTLHQGDDFEFGHAASLFLHLHTKAPNLEVLRALDFPKEVVAGLSEWASNAPVVAFPIIASLVNVVSTVQATSASSELFSETSMAQFESVLTPQIWKYLSPSLGKYHVEAAKALWQMHSLAASERHLEASLTALLRGQGPRLSYLDQDPAAAARHFAVLWNHSVSTPNAGKQAYASTRRASSMPSISPQQSSDRQRILGVPLMLVLDLLRQPRAASYDVVSSWLHGLPSLEQVFQVHFDKLDDLLYSNETTGCPDTTVTERHHESSTRALEYLVSHFLAILKVGGEWTWECLGDMVLPANRAAQRESGLVRLAKLCSDFLCNDNYRSRTLEQTSLEVLQTALLGPRAMDLKPLELDSLIIERLLVLLEQTSADSQGQLLLLITEALKLRLTNESVEAPEDRRRTSTSSKRPSTAGVRPSAKAVGLDTVAASTPPPQLLLLLRKGFSSTVARPYLDEWLQFLSRVLPIYSSAIFSGLIPLVECLCLELSKSHKEMIEASQIGMIPSATATEPTIMALLEALEMVLARAHRCLDEEQQTDTEPRPMPQSRGLLGNVKPSVFRSDAIAGKTAQANSRLTVILTFQDAIRTSLKLWIWGSHHAEVDDFDKTSAATTSHNALRVRNRTRHLLEQIFAVEPLESLEVVISSWRSEPTQSTQATASLNLLHVLQGTRPKSVIPAILDALCSRINPSALPPERLSTQSTELNALDVALFLSAYLKSTEDDAIDEVWPDCMAFLRDVLSNPLPYRQVLPALLLTILLLGQKLENTNFGEQRRMRKELGDSFNRLLAAAFTTMPSGYVQDAHAAGQHHGRGEKSSSVAQHSSTSLLTALKDVTADIEVILETTDRATVAVNSISSNLIGPMLRAKVFPDNITLDTLKLLLQLSKKAPLAKTWKKELLEAFNDPRLLTTTTEMMEVGWFPVLHQWCLHDKERMPEVLARLAPPSSAGIMFGVGANAARLEADRRTQLNLRRVSLLMMASPEDSFALHLRLINEKLAELFEASPSSSPSAAIKAELFMLCRALALSTSSVQLGPMWPIINQNLHAALASLLPGAVNEAGFPNLALLQGCKLLDLLIALSPDEFQLHEWLYVTDTIDAVYQPVDWDPSALSDQVALATASEAVEQSSNLVPSTPIAGAHTARRRPLLDSNLMASQDDFKAMARDDFVLTVLRPFLSQLSMYAYEAVYSMNVADVDACRRNLLEDLLDLSTIVE